MSGTPLNIYVDSVPLSLDGLGTESFAQWTVVYNLADRLFEYGAKVTHSFKHEQMVEVDRNKVHRILTNLLLNACQSMIVPDGERGRVWVDTETVVTDSGGFV